MTHEIRDVTRAMPPIIMFAYLVRVALLWLGLLCLCCCLAYTSGAPITMRDIERYMVYMTTAIVICMVASS